MNEANQKPEYVQLPAAYFPVVGTIPTGSLVLIQMPNKMTRGSSVSRYFPEKVADYIQTLKSHFADQVFVKIDNEENQTLMGIREKLRRLRQTLGNEDRKIGFVIYEADRFSTETLMMEADYSFHVHDGYCGTLLIELGKARSPGHLICSTATVYTAGLEKANGIPMG